MPHVHAWGEEDFKSNLRKRFEAAKKYREKFEPQWEKNLRTINNAISHGGADELFSLSFDNLVELEAGEVDGGGSEIGMNYAFKYLRFFHSQLSANPPAVTVSPRSPDPTDRRKADAADRLVRWGMRDKDIPETVDQCTWKGLQIGTAWIKEVFDKTIGDVVDFNEETSEVNLEGDHRIYSPDTFDVWVDAEAKSWRGGKAEVRFIFEEHQLSLEEAMFRYPEHAEKFKEIAGENKSRWHRLFGTTKDQEEEGKVVIYEYWEKGMPVNGMAGRYAVFMEDYTLIEYGKNPHHKAKLPYHLFTYIDVPNQVYGKSLVEYVARIQEMLNRFDTQIVDSVEAHGVARLVFSNMEVTDEAVSNSSWDYIKVEGQGGVHYINPPGLSPDMWKFRDSMLIGLQELFGINDSMLGIQRREQSAVSQQTAIEAGTMLHRRLFKKYSNMVEGLYKDFLGLIVEHWDEPRTILVIGKEKAFEAADLRGADIEGGYDVSVDYGTSLPLDPNMRREAIMLLAPMLKEAGLSSKQLIKFIKLNELEAVHDRMEMAADRQREIFEEMIAKVSAGLPEYIAPQEMEDHAGRLEYAYDFLETSEFKFLPEEAKTLIRQHVKDREALAAAQAAPGAPTQPADAMPMGMPGVSGALTPELPTTVPAQADVGGSALA